MSTPPSNRRERRSGREGGALTALASAALAPAIICGAVIASLWAAGAMSRRAERRSRRDAERRAARTRQAQSFGKQAKRMRRAQIAQNLSVRATSRRS